MLNVAIMSGVWPRAVWALRAVVLLSLSPLLLPARRMVLVMLRSAS